jgi:hypothetical protein
MDDQAALCIFETAAWYSAKATCHAAPTSVYRNHNAHILVSPALVTGLIKQS